MGTRWSSPGWLHHGARPLTPKAKPKPWHAGREGWVWIVVGPGVPCGAELPNLRHRVKPGAADQRRVACRGGRTVVDAREAKLEAETQPPRRWNEAAHASTTVLRWGRSGKSSMHPNKTRQRIKNCREADRALRVSRREGRAARSRREGRDLSLQTASPPLIAKE